MSWSLRSDGDTGNAATVVNATIVWRAEVPHDHQRIGCAHSYYCPTCGCGQTVVPDPCDAPPSRA